MKATLFTSIRGLLLATGLVIAPCAALAATASSSELLEKGIYTEETKGDVDAAIAIYSQLIAEAKAGQTLAAQAQFRLGQCYQKKNRPAEALAAFEKLIRDYPDQKELVAKAREQLPADMVMESIPWVDGERLQFTFKLPAGMNIGTMETRADLVDADGRKVWRVGRRMSAGGESVSSVDVDQETFRPLSSYWKHSLLGEVSAVYRTGEVEMQRAGTKEPVRVPLDKTVYDNEEAFHLLRRLPLQLGYKTTVPIVTTLGGGSIIPIGVEVNAREEVDVPAGKFECFKVKLTVVNQDFWISADAHRYLIKMELNGVTGSLASITQRHAAQPVQFRDDELGISLTAPADWVFQRYEGKRSAKVRILDPGADADAAWLNLVATDSLSAAAKQSPRAWAETSFREQVSKKLEEAAIRPNSWKTQTVAGRPGISYIADYKEGDKPRVGITLVAIGPKNSESFVLTCVPEKFEALRAAFESITASYRTRK
jgi:Protein of unknown function (DUF3108)/Tetratricopeptide repeat